MTTVGLRPVAGRHFRSNPGYEIVPLDRMSDAEEIGLTSLREEELCFGILRPLPESDLRIKTVCEVTARLFQALRKPARLPDSVLEDLGPSADSQIAALVLDRVIQVAGDDGFQDGAGAVRTLYRQVSPPSTGGRIARLSLDAVQFGQRLREKDPMRLSAQMYFFNRVPVTPRWQRDIAASKAVLRRFLGVAAGGPCAHQLAESWQETHSSRHGGEWFFWSHRQARPKVFRGSSSAGFKLYISPRLSSLPEVLPAVLEVLTEEGVPRFKIGARLPNLTRPDKLVAYLPSFDDVERVGNRLAEVLRGSAAHGVPFTGDFSDDGSVSWGMDPPDEGVVDWLQRPSWRLWITNRLANALVDACRHESPEIEPWLFALERLRLDGIDTDTWTPRTNFQDLSPAHPNSNERGRAA